MKQERNNERERTEDNKTDFQVSYEMSNQLYREKNVIQGPLPREPEEKVDPWNFQRKESGVRRLLVFKLLCVG